MCLKRHPEGMSVDFTYVSTLHPVSSLSLPFCADDIFDSVVMKDSMQEMESNIEALRRAIEEEAKCVLSKYKTWKLRPVLTLAIYFSFNLVLRALILVNMDIGDAKVRKELVEKRIEMTVQEKLVLEQDLNVEISKWLEVNEKVKELKNPEDYKRELMEKAATAEKLKKELKEESALNERLKARLESLQQAEARLKELRADIAKLEKTKSAIEDGVRTKSKELAKRSGGPIGASNELQARLSEAQRDYQELCAHYALLT